VLTTTKSFDNLNRLTSTTSVSGSGLPPLASSLYQYNAANQRTRLTREDSSYWDFGYDSLGQVTAGNKKLADGTAVLGHAYGYSFDTIGNLKTTTVNGQSAAYTTDTAGLNQYTQRTVPPVFDILGTAASGAKVAVNLVETQRQGDLFYKQLSTANNTAPKWQSIDILAGKSGAGTGGADAITRQSGHLFLAKSPESFTYDLDGNLTSDGQWTYGWDAENRLVSMQTVGACLQAIPNFPAQRLEFAYDAAGRRIRKIVKNLTGSAYIVSSDTRFLYDGWNLVAEFSASTSASTSSFNLLRSYVWGLDLSGSSQGAGGVGGLLCINALSPLASSLFPVYDGNGNVVALIDVASGALAASYEYGPFGEPLKSTGPAAALNPFRFSTKYTDAETGLLYYGFRYYNTSTRRWPNRDPLEEQGRVNLYGFVGNDPLSRWDLLGLYIELWYGNHPVQAGKAHSKLWLITDEQDVANNSGLTFIPAASKTERAPQGQSGVCLWFISIGAGPDGALDELIADFNRDRDVNEKLGNPSLVTTFADKGAAVSFLSTVQTRNTTMNANFRNTTLEYELFPGSSYTSFDDWDEYNSNSYISGLLGSFGYSAPASGASTPGYSKPVPAFVFTKSFSTTDELKKEWKGHYPNF
jgi:RHS repeat-associated protein